MPSSDTDIEGIDPARLPAGARQVLIALEQSQQNQPVDQRCHFCAQPIAVEPLGLEDRSPTAWRTHCPCGKSNNTFRGV
jgi:hypothetical protein